MGEYSLERIFILRHMEKELADIKAILRRQEDLLQAFLKAIRRKSGRKPARRSK